MLCGFPPVQQAAIGDCLSFDPFSFDQNGLASSEVDVGWRQITDAFVIAQVIVVNDESLDCFNRGGLESVAVSGLGWSTGIRTAAARSSSC